MAGARPPSRPPSSEVRGHSPGRCVAVGDRCPPLAPSLPSAEGPGRRRGHAPELVPPAGGGRGGMRVSHTTHTHTTHTHGVARSHRGWAKRGGGGSLTGAGRRRRGGREGRERKGQRGSRETPPPAPGGGRAGVTNLPARSPPAPRRGSGRPPAQGALPRGTAGHGGFRALPAAPLRSAALTGPRGAAPRRPQRSAPRGQRRARPAASRPGKLPVKPGGCVVCEVSLCHCRSSNFPTAAAKRNREASREVARPPGARPGPGLCPRTGSGHRDPARLSHPGHRGGAGRGAQDRPRPRFGVDFVPSGSGSQREAAIKRCPPARPRQRPRPGGAALPRHRHRHRHRHRSAAAPFESRAFEFEIDTNRNKLIPAMETHETENM
ncbi:translation initiation factor IF-2-like [Oenanthe melanoleuca]|uniref:translation initiation factor IF-2-like n=1 Tax=Oenanthe melanoleuca TaxID=2939378 RepID=UPI0024C0E84F|nr:translation initiation factor IF-2-like [Oenanthe melanoleuca]